MILERVRGDIAARSIEFLGKDRTDRMKKLHQFLVNALLLSAVSLLMRTVGVVFQVYIANRVGAEALGLYGLFSGVYSFAVTFATSGIHLAATRLTAEALGDGAEGGVRAGMRRCFVYSLCFGVCGSLGLYALAPSIGTGLLDEVRVIRPLQILAFALVPISLSSAMSGYFTACRRVYKNAAAQVLEQAVRIGATVAILGFLLREQDPERACIGLVLGSTVAEISSFLFSLIFYLFDRRRYARDGGDYAREKALTKKLCGIAMPVAFSSYMRSGLVTLEHALIPKGLRQSGASRTQALETYGILGSMVFPVILFPTALLGSFSGLLVPELAECRARGNRKEISYIAGRVYSLALWFSIGTAAVLCCFAEEFGMVIYGSETAARYIRLLSPLIPVMYLDNTTDAMLKGLGQQVYTMGVNIADAALSVILVWLLIPRMGIEGYVLTIYVCELFNAVCSVMRLLTVSGMRPRVVKWVVKPLLCAVGATTLAHPIAKLSIFDAMAPTPRLCIHVVLTVVFYLLMLCGIHAVEAEEFSWIRKLLTREKKARTDP